VRFLDSLFFLEILLSLCSSGFLYFFSWFTQMLTRRIQ
jgi:hypothetical protein